MSMVFLLVDLGLHKLFSAQLGCIHTESAIEGILRARSVAASAAPSSEGSSFQKEGTT